MIVVTCLLLHQDKRIWDYWSIERQNSAVSCCGGGPASTSIRLWKEAELLPLGTSVVICNDLKSREIVHLLNGLFSRLRSFGCLLREHMQLGSDCASQNHQNLSTSSLFHQTDSRYFHLSAARHTWTSANNIIGLASVCDWILLTDFLCSQWTADSTLHTVQPQRFKAESPHRRPRWGLWVIIRRSPKQNLHWFPL